VEYASGLIVNVPVSAPLPVSVSQPLCVPPLPSVSSTKIQPLAMNPASAWLLPLMLPVPRSRQLLTVMAVALKTRVPVVPGHGSEVTVLASASGAARAMAAATTKDLMDMICTSR
jgi:hypothetical protein